MPESAASPARGRALVVIPTYNEIDTLERAVTDVLALSADLDILVVDDGSPDGTGALADRLAAGDPRVSVLHRTAKDGLGRAYLAGFRVGEDRGYPLLVEFDADGSHPARTIPAMLAELDEDPAVGLVIGSRWVPGGRLVDWSAARQALSRAGNVYARLMLGLDVRDTTAGFRIYRSSTLAAIHLEDVHSRGYCFQIDMTIRTADAGIRIVEVPIEFRERIAGSSKMSRSIVLEAMGRVTVWGLERRFRRLFGRRAAVPVPAAGRSVSGR